MRLHLDMLSLTRTPRLVKERPSALLAVVILSRSISRAEVADLLWPDSAHARSNLRVELHRAEHGLYAGTLNVTPAHLSLQDGAEVDVWQARESAAQGHYTQALAQAEATLLPWISEVNPNFDEWLQAQRVEWSNFYQETLRQAARQAEAGGDLTLAREHCKALMALDPLSEEARRQCLRLCVLLHDEDAARRVYAECQSMTRREFGREPDAATRAWLEQLQPQGQPAGASGVSLPRLPLVGRAALLRDLQRASTCTVLLGDPGVGKSRLALEFARQFDRALVVSGLVSGAPLAAVAFTLDEAGAVAYSAPARLARETLRGSGAGQEFTPARREELHAGLAVALLEAVGARGCLILDDLHLLDSASLEVLRSVLHTAAQLPAGQRPALVGTARAFELEGSPAANWVRQERAGGHLRTLEVPPLSGADLLSLVQHLSAGAGASGGGGTQFAAVLQEATGGNPLFFQETLRSLLGSGHVRVDEQGRWHVAFQASGGYAHLPLPSSVNEAVLGRAELLPTPARRMLDMLCLQALPLSAPVLAQACHLSEWDVLECARTLKAAGFLYEISGGYTLRHDLQRESLRRALPDQHRGVLHAALAGALANAGASAQEVAQCFEAGGRSAEAALWWLRAAEQSRRAFALPEAVAAYEHALELGLDEERTIQTLLMMFDLLHTASNYEQARAVLARLRAFTSKAVRQASTHDAECRVREALLHLLDGSYLDAIAITDALLQSEQPPHLTGTAYYVRGLARLKTGQFDQAAADLKQSRQADPLNRSRRAVEAAHALTQLAAMRGDLNAANAEAQGLEHLVALVSDPQLQAHMHITLGTIAAMQSDFATAKRHFEPALELCRTHQFAVMRSQLAHNLGQMALDEGHYQQSLDLMLEAFPNMIEQGKPAAHVGLSAAYFGLGQFRQAFKELDLALDACAARQEKVSALRFLAARHQFDLSLGNLIDETELDRLQAETEELGLPNFKTTQLGLRLHAAILREDSPEHVQALRAELAALPYKPSDAEDMAWLLGWSALYLKDAQAVKSALADAPLSPRLLALKLLAGETETSPPTEALAYPSALSQLLLAHAKAELGDIAGVAERAERLQALSTEAIENHIERMLQTLVPI